MFLHVLDLFCTKGRLDRDVDNVWYDDLSRCAPRTSHIFTNIDQCICYCEVPIVSRSGTE